ncbi:MAG: tRNA (adenosine(37)-N6)-dimethylallyltransferase MiaA, partial [Cytophagaceae bacterium]
MLVILGPTASGKTQLAVKLANQFIQEGQPAEIISADSRQVY